MDSEQLEEYAAAWNRHDIDGIMKFMTEDCVFEIGSGAEAWGTRYAGAGPVREAFMGVWKSMPNVRFENATHFVHGNRGCSEWTLTGTKADGSRIEVNGCDLFTFAGGRIRLKNSYLKHRRAPR